MVLPRRPVAPSGGPGGTAFRLLRAVSPTAPAAASGLPTCTGPSTGSSGHAATSKAGDLVVTQHMQQRGASEAFGGSEREQRAVILCIADAMWHVLRHHAAVALVEHNPRHLPLAERLHGDLNCRLALLARKIAARFCKLRQWQSAALSFWAAVLRACAPQPRAQTTQHVPAQCRSPPKELQLLCGCLVLPAQRVCRPTTGEAPRCRHGSACPRQRLARSPRAVRADHTKRADWRHLVRESRHGD